jgi:putative transport protein
VNTIANIFREHTELAVFLTLALGFVIGLVKIGNFKLGPMLGCLFAGMLIGQMHIEISPVVKLIFFDLFLFATGYKVGPQFFYGLKKDALPQVALTVIICVSCLLTAFIVSKLMGYNVGTAAGLLAGAFTESTVIGTASDAINKLALPDAEKKELINAIPVAYAVSYLIGTSTLVWFLSTIAPKILGVNLKEESKKLAAKLGDLSETSSDINSAYKDWTIRAIRISGARWNNMTIANIEKSIPGARIFIQRVRKNGELLDPQPDMQIQEGDIVAVSARQQVMLDQLSGIGEELLDKELLDFPIAKLNIVVTNKQATGRTLKSLADEYGQGVMMTKLIRGGQEMPFETGTVIQNGDILMVSGRQNDVERASINLGFAELATNDTDMIFLGTGIVLGGLVGLLSMEIGGIVITLSTSGGALFMGLIFGWIHSKTPRFGKIPDAALWIFDTMGLATFLAIVGIAAGPTVITGIEKTGFSIIFSGLIVAILPHIVGLLAGKYLLKMNPVILLGAQSGAGTTTTALKAIQDSAQSKMPVLGYTIPYALGNIILTAWGPVIVSLMTR